MKASSFPSFLRKVARKVISYQQGSEATEVKLIAVCDLDSCTLAEAVLLVVRRCGFSLNIREGKSIRFLSKPNLLPEEEEAGKKRGKINERKKKI